MKVRNHKVYTYTILRNVEICVPDPPGSGEMHRTGQYEKQEQVVTVVAETENLARAWLHDGRRAAGCKIVEIKEVQLDACIETHTY